MGGPEESAGPGGRHRRLARRCRKSGPDAYPEIRTKVLALAADCHRRWDVLNAEGFDSRLLIALTNVGSREVPKYLEMAFPMSELAAIGMTAP